MLKMGFSLAISCVLALQISCTKKTDDTDTTINSVVPENIKGLDPMYINDVYSGDVGSQIYETLLEYHYLKRPLTLKPLLAAKMPEVSKDGLTHTFKLKPGVKFHDNEAFPGGKGREVVANDFLYAWRRIADPTNRSDGFWIFDGKIQGLNEWREKVAKGKADYTTPIEGFQAPDQHTIVVKLNKPYFQLHYVLSMVYTSPIAKEAIEKYGSGYPSHPVGTGPFVFESWIRGEKVTLVKNLNWHGQTYPTVGEAGDEKAGYLNDAGKALPFVDKLVFHEIVEEELRWKNLMKGSLDFTVIPKLNFDTAISNGKLSEDLVNMGLKLFVTREPDVTYTAFNMLDPILSKNLDLRKAMTMAYDSQTLIDKFYNGRAIVAQSPIPPDVDAYDDNFKNPYKTYDVEKAKELMTKAGFPNGEGLPEFEFSSTASSTAKQMAEFFKQNMEQIGVKIKIVTTSWPQFTEKVRERKGQIWSVAWLADYPDAENFLQLLYGDNVSPGPNGANFKNSKFDKLYKQAAVLPPGPKRTRIYRKMRDIVVEQAPWIPAAHRLGYSLQWKWIKNYKKHSIIHNYYKYLRVDPKQRAKVKAEL